MNIKNYGKRYKKGFIQQRLFSFESEINLVKCKKVDPQFAYFYSTHYPKSLGIMGRQFNYKILNYNNFIGIIGVNSPPKDMKVFREYFNTKDDTLYLNNNVFRCIESETNRGTKILKKLRERVFNDYYKSYGVFLLGLMTFVEPPRTGIVYRADNWDFLGMTKGMECKRRKENNNEKTFSKGIPKYIFAFKYNKKYKNRILR